MSKSSKGEGVDRIEREDLSDVEKWIALRNMKSLRVMVDDAYVALRAQRIRPKVGIQDTLPTFPVHDPKERYDEN